VVADKEVGVVAFRWRIRRKLMLGLGLVVVIMALLLTGTVKGLMAYRATLRSIDSKLAELKEAEAFKVAVTDLDPRQRDLEPITSPSRRTSASPDEEFRRLQERVRHAREALTAYEARLQETLINKRDPDKGYQELQLIDAINKGFATLEKATEGLRAPQADANPTISLLDHPEAGEAARALSRMADELQEAIYHDLYRRLATAKTDHTRSLAFVITTCVLSVLLMASLLHVFYRWLIHPINDLQRGVGRVAHGDFEHLISLRSGDEMEELADAFNDMTVRLRDTYRDLEHQVNERSRQLVRSEQLASVGYLAAGVAHEINNPMHIIAMHGEALQARLRELFDNQRLAIDRSPNLAGQKATIDKYLKTIQDEAFRCKKITTKLLDFSRGGDRYREATDLVELAQSVLDMVQHLPTCKGKQIVLQAPGRLVAWVNAEEIKSVVLNLIANALDSMDDGGTLTIRLTEHFGTATLEFTDTGCGMAREILDNIFEPFFTKSRTGKGTGLGLSISHRIVSQHGGEIVAASPGPSHGSTFTVRLPVQPPVEAVREDMLGQAA
jgi:signal transduction histidine kinase